MYHPQLLGENKVLRRDGGTNAYEKGDSKKRHGCAGCNVNGRVTRARVS